MSTNYEQRAYEWGRWLGHYDYLVVNDMRIVGFIHQCGHANLFSETASVFVSGDTFCVGCRFEIARPIAECPTPLLAPKSTLDRTLSPA